MAESTPTLELASPPLLGAVIEVKISKPGTAGFGKGDWVGAFVSGKRIDFQWLKDHMPAATAAAAVVKFEKVSAELIKLEKASEGFLGLDVTFEFYQNGGTFSSGVKAAALTARICNPMHSTLVLTAINFALEGRWGDLCDRLRLLTCPCVKHAKVEQRNPLVRTSLVLHATVEEDGPTKGWTVLMLAARANQAEVVRALLACGADIKVKCSNVINTISFLRSSFQFL